MGQLATSVVGRILTFCQPGSAMWQLPGRTYWCSSASDVNINCTVAILSSNWCLH